MTGGVLDEELFDHLDRWAGSEVTVRIVVEEPNQLVAVFSGRLGARSKARPPALFWPLESGAAPVSEVVGIYLHPELYEGGRIHPGDYVLEYRQAGVTVNVRLLPGELRT